MYHFVVFCATCLSLYSSILLFTAFRFIHALVPWQNLEGIVFLKSPRRAILYDRKKNSQHRHCHAVFNHHSRHSMFANTGYTTGWKVPCLDSQQHTVRKRRTLQKTSSRHKCLRLRQSCHAATPAAKQSELSYADWLNCCDRGESWYILRRPDLGKTLFVP